MASIGGSQLPNFGPGSRTTREADGAKKTTTSTGTQTDKAIRARTFKPGQVMAQLNGKVAEAKKLKKMALRKARRRRRRKKRQGK